MTKRTVVALAALGLLAFALWMPMHAGQQREIEAVRAAIENYVQGHATGKGEFFSNVFHPDSKLFWVRDGQLMQRTSADYIAGASGRPAARRSAAQALDREHRHHRQRCGGEGRARLPECKTHRLHVHAENQRRVENREQNVYVRTEVRALNQ